MKKLLIALFLVAGLFTASISAQTPVFPSVPLPAGGMVFVNYNQLGSPVVTGGVAAIYPVAGQLGLYMTTTAIISPQLKLDPTTNKNFYGVTTALRQGLHKDVLDTGRFSFLLGGDLGPSIGNSSTTSTNLTVNFSSSLVITTLYQATPAISLVLPIRGVYIANIGWNPEVEFGIVVNFSKLPKASASLKHLKRL